MNSRVATHEIPLPLKETNAKIPKKKRSFLIGTFLNNLFEINPQLHVTYNSSSPLPFWKI